MLETKGYYDLCMSEELFTVRNVEKTLKTLYNFGYRTVAINQIVDDANVEGKKKKKKGEPRESPDTVPIPVDLEKINAKIKELELKGFKVLNRLTVSFASQESLHKILKSTHYKKYDLIAAMPTTLVAFAFTCGTFEADILTFDPMNKMGFKINRKLYNKLIDRSYHFELPYGPAIEDSTKRKNVIHAAHMYHSFGKSRNIIISSWADRVILLRNSYDVINLGIILGLTDQQCKNAIQHSCRQVVINAAGRRHGKSVMFVENLTAPSPAEEEEAINLIESEDEDMETDQPAHKKSKQ